MGRIGGYGHEAEFLRVKKEKPHLADFGMINQTLPIHPEVRPAVSTLCSLFSSFNLPHLPIFSHC